MKTTNLNILANYYREEKNNEFKDHFKKVEDINDIHIFIKKLAKHIYKLDMETGKKGHLYCLYNPMYLHYGKNVYKFGRAKNLLNRVKGYTTAYLEKSTVMAKTCMLPNKIMAEKILFYLLKDNRMKNRREFFNCDIDRVKNTFKVITDMFNQKNEIIFLPTILNKITNDIYKLCEVKKDVNKQRAVILNKQKQNCKSIFEADNIDKTTYIHYLELKKNNQISMEQKYAMERYEYKIMWKLNGEERKFDLPFLKEWYGKHHILYKLRTIMGHTEEPEITWDNYDIHKVKLKEQLVMLKEVINMLGFSINVLKVGGKREIPREEFLQNMNKVINQTALFTNTNKSQPLFGYKKCKINQINTSRGFIGFIKTVLKEFGLTIKINRVDTKIKKNNKWTTKTTYFYELDYLKYINLYR